MSEQRQIRNLRHMAWERAKGELRSMKHTYWDEEDAEKYKLYQNELEKFIEIVESGGLHE